MGAIFFANGPAFKAGYTNQWIKMVDEYQVFAHLLNIQGKEHEGAWERVEPMLLVPGDDLTTTESGGTSMKTSFNAIMLLLLGNMLSVLV